MDWQLTITLLLTFAACLYLARRAWHSFRGVRPGCAGGCHCQNKEENGGMKLEPLGIRSIQRPGGGEV